VRALALVADVVYGSPASMRDSRAIQLRHGEGRHPYPVNRDIYDQSIDWSVNQ